MYTNFLFVYPASFVGKRVTSTEEVNIFLEQVSNYFPVILELDCLKPELTVWTVRSPQNNLLGEKTDRSAHKAP